MLGWIGRRRRGAASVGGEDLMSDSSGAVADFLVSIDVGELGPDPFGNGFCLLQFLGAGYAGLEAPGDAERPPR